MHFSTAMVYLYLFVMSLFARRFVITKVTILGGMDKWEFKFKKVLEPVTATADAIVVRVRQHYPFYVVRKLCHL